MRSPILYCPVCRKPKTECWRGVACGIEWPPVPRRYGGRAALAVVTETSWQEMIDRQIELQVEKLRQKRAIKYTLFTLLMGWVLGLVTAAAWQAVSQ
jgi:hypothetical protein